MRGLLKSVVQRWSVPDPSVYFWRSAKTRDRAIRTVEAVGPDVILTSSPPHSNHDIGRWLSEQTSISWVADFRDPYIIDPRYCPTGIRRIRWGAHRRFEESVYQHAAMTVHAIPIQARWARRVYPFARDRVRILTNGCPPEIAQGRVEPDVTPGGRKSVRVVGVIGDDEAIELATAVSSLAKSSTDIELRLVGRPTAVHDRLRDMLGDRLVVTGLIPHDQALRQIAGADVLVCPLSAARSRNLLLSSKLFEYLATGKPTIVINPTLPDRQFLRRVPFARVLDHPSVDGVAAAIRESLESHHESQSGVIDRFRQAYNRREQVRRLAGWLDGLTVAAVG